MKKGFTLVELLAVLLLLGVIGLIAIPAVGKILDRSRARALDGVKNELIQASKKYTADNLSMLPDYDGSEICISVDTLSKSPYIAEDKVIDPSTEQLLTGYIKVTYQAKYNNYKYEYINTCGNYLNYANGTPIYYNPVTNTKCTMSESISQTGTKTGCMKWYTFNDDSKNDAINLILDHNTTAVCRWSNTSLNSTKADYVLQQLTNDISSWHSVPKSSSRLIDMDEIKKITNITYDKNTTTWENWVYFDSNSQIKVANSTNKSKYFWLFDYTQNCFDYGCNFNDVSTFGYWTINPSLGKNNIAWGIFSEGRISDLYVDNQERYGIRPVISISKNLLK